MLKLGLGYHSGFRALGVRYPRKVSRDHDLQREVAGYIMWPRYIALEAQVPP